MSLQLIGKSALITGGSAGIGAASAAALLKDGASVTLMGRNAETLEKKRDQLQPLVQEGAQITLVEGDGLNKHDVKRALQTAHSVTGQLDICVANVGLGEIRPILLHDEDTFTEQYRYNVLSTFLILRHATPLMADTGGSIVCISSEAARLAMPWAAGYCTAKSALEGLVRAAAEELSRFKIRVNAVRPGITRTEGTEMLTANPGLEAMFANERPLGRLGEPEEIAAGVRYLAGPESSWVTGQSLAIEGGMELRKAADLTMIAEQMYGKEIFDKVLAGKEPLEES